MEINRGKQPSDELTLQFLIVTFYRSRRRRQKNKTQKEYYLVNTAPFCFDDKQEKTCKFNINKTNKQNKKKDNATYRIYKILNKQKDHYLYK